MIQLWHLITRRVVGAWAPLVIKSIVCGKLIVAIYWLFFLGKGFFNVKQSLGPRLPNTCACAMCADACWRSTFSFHSPTPCSGGWRWLLPPTFSELTQYVHSGKLSPEEHCMVPAWWGREGEGERLWIVKFSIGRPVRTRHLRVWFQRIREWDMTLTNTQTIQCVRTQTCKWIYKIRVRMLRSQENQEKKVSSVWRVSMGSSVSQNVTLCIIPSW